MRRSLFAIAIGFVVLGIASPALAADGSDGTQVVLTGHVTVARGERSDTIVVFHGPVVVQGTVSGSVVVGDGRVTIAGPVSGSVVVLNGRTTVTSAGRIGGDLVTRTAPVVQPGAVVGGEIRRIRSAQYWSSYLFKVFGWLAFTVSTLVLGVILLGLAPRAMERAADAARTAIGPVVGWGVLLLIGLPIVAIILIATIVGLPLGLGLLFALFLVYTVGYTVGTFVLGRLLVKGPERRYPAFFAGWGIARLVALVPILAGLAWTVAVVVGLGAVAVALWRGRSSQFQAETALTPAPPPPAPTR
jgi:hypothetical protein